MPIGWSPIAPGHKVLGPAAVVSCGIEGDEDAALDGVPRDAARAASERIAMACPAKLQHGAMARSLARSEETHTLDHTRCAFVRRRAGCTGGTRYMYSCTGTGTGTGAGTGTGDRWAN